MMRPSSCTVLAIYPDPDAAARAVRELRRRGFRRAVSIHHTKSARVVTDLASARSLRWDYLILALVGAAAVGALLEVVAPWIAVAVHRALVLVVLALLGLAGWAVTQAIAIYRNYRLAERYRPWVMPGESLVVVWGRLSRAGTIFDLLRQSGDSEPATFLIREPTISTDLPDDLLARERFGGSRLKLHAMQLAARHKLSGTMSRPEPLQARVQRAEEIIETVTSDLSEVTRLEQAVSAAAEWLLDNAYAVQKHSGDVRRNLSRRFFNVLPALETDGQALQPRVYHLAVDLVAHTDAEVHQQDIVDFVMAYQEVAKLTISELWVLPLMLRLALIEHLSQLAVMVDRRQHDHEQADFWANRLLNAARRAPDYLLIAVAELARERPNPSAYVVDRLVSQLQGEAVALDPIRAWLERKFGASLAEVIQHEQSQHAAHQVTIANAIGTLRELSQVDWRDVFEAISAVQSVLADDPAGIYPRMDFGTRDSYRTAVEQIARYAPISEVEVARLAIELAETAETDGVARHVGFYLVDRGRARLEQLAGYQPPLGKRLQRWALAHPALVYFGGIGFLTTTILILGAALGLGAPTTVPSRIAVPILVLIGLLPASELAVQLVNYAITRALPPRVLPKLSFETGIPDEWRTLVVVPTLLLSEETVSSDLEHLEIRFLANQDPNLHFALLADFPDAPEPTTPRDAPLLEMAIQGIQELNRRYGTDRFSLFYRHRVWSQSEQVWMGWERKRGKLEELNCWLIRRHDPAACGSTHPTLTIEHVGDGSALDGVRFVITLDADTQLPYGTARRLVGTLAHPLNRPRLAPDGRTVEAGYTIIQPRTSISLPSATATRFSRLMAGPAGTDPYTLAVSDVYQDLTGEGTYHGKGIYDVEAFHRVLGGRFPEATLLSHDLLEGAYVRVGLASDIELLEQFPSTYLTYTVRQHRWIRGDWQVAQWCAPRVPGPGGGSEPNPLSSINRWKIFDNLRRSLIPPAALALLLAGWSLQPERAALWSLVVALVFFLPPMLLVASWLVSQPDNVEGLAGVVHGWREVTSGWLRALFAVAILPHQAFTTVDAIIRVWYRRLVSHRFLLQWQTSQMAHLGAADRELRFLLGLGSIDLVAAGAGGYLARVDPIALLWAIPFLALWLASPLMVAALSAPSKRPGGEAIPLPDRLMLRRFARQTWRFFDDFVGPEGNWLPPDNYQAALRVEVAQRTSPTNIGLWLMSTVAAHDFGYLTLDQVIQRGEATLDTVSKLERFEGHLLNWYNTATLQPLIPRYVSTVDSGNFLASLWSISRAYRELTARPLIGPPAIRGLADTLELVQESLAAGPSDGVGIDRVSTVSDLTAALAGLFEAPPASAIETVGRLRAALEPSQMLAELLRSRLGDDRRRRGGPLREQPRRRAIESPVVEASYWADQLVAQIRGWLDLVDRYLPWIERLPYASDKLNGSPNGVARSCAEATWLEAPSLRDVANGPTPMLAALAGQEGADASPDPPAVGVPRELADLVASSQQRAAAMLERIERLVALVDELAREINMSFLYDPNRRLFLVGYNVEIRRPDTSYFDLLASEARLASFVAIARGDAPVDHWFSLGRPFGRSRGRTVLLSWTGTMFEYLMPLIWTRSFDQSLLDVACREAVAQQIAYGESRGVPWGISEAAFSAVDANQIYQYQAFGVPGLGLKRGLAADLVVAPYASALALMVDPLAATKNLKRLAQLGARGSYGFYDSIDYTPKRRPEGQAGTIVSTYMAHHQGMFLLSINNALHGSILQVRFHSDPRVQAAEPLLYERMPLAPPVIEGGARDTVPTRPVPSTAGEATAAFHSPNTRTPRAHLLANTSYALMITGAGGGYSRWRDFEISRWRSDTTLDNWGSFIYLRDVDQNVTWSATHQPVRRQASYHAVTFKPDRAEFERRDLGIGTVTEIVVSPEDDAEIRRLTLVNQSNRRRQIEVTSYLELALAPHNVDRGHPAFSKLFIQTQAVPARNALLAWRKPRSPQEPSIWAAHQLALPSDLEGDVAYETDRARFIGRGRGLDNPIALEQPLSNSDRAVLDPIFSIRCRVVLEPGQRTQLAFITAAGESRDKLLSIVEKYQDLRATERAFDLAAFQAQLELRHLRVTADDVQRFLHLASHLLYPNARLRAAEQQLRQNRLGQARLWAYGISGDLPIMLVIIGDRRDADVVAEALQAHTFLRLRGLRSDLVILNEEPHSYAQPLQDYLRTLIQAHAQYTPIDQPGGIFLRSTDGMPSEELTLLLTVARVVLVASRGPLIQQLSRPAEVELPPPLIVQQRIPEEPSSPLPFLELPYFNGIGGFTADGHEYAIYLGPGIHTPAPWVNVMANPTFGALISESGQGFVWSGNSQSNRLLPWSNDPVLDPSGDAIYVRDDETGRYWTPTPLPIREIDAYRARHGQGYTVFEHNSHAIEQELVTFVPLDDAGGAPVRVQRLRLRNRSSRRRRLSVIFYAEWVLGDVREETQMHVVTSWDSDSRALLARNVYNPDFGSRVAFASASLPVQSFTADRTEFFGRNGSRARPAALSRQYLARHTGAGIDPCAALQVIVEIDPGQDAEVTFLLGQAADAAQARSLVRRFRDPERVEQALRSTRAWWDRLLDTIQVETPVLAVNFLLNRWLLYQTLSCRFWARSAFYQSGGAYGFRDQLQDAMALVYAAPQLARQHILAAAARQFVEGDVQHWWHPPSGAGVRTRISDDLLWLPYVVAHYIRVTGDGGILDEVVPFLEGHVLDEHEQEAYFVPATALEAGTLLEHCRRAIARGLTCGPHGLPLIGAGDWNDGLNLVGIGGKGESVWLAWFLVEVLREFADLLEGRDEGELAEEYRARARELVAAIEEHAWDGEWYLRAFFDDGTPLGSKQSAEARIDSLPQSWAMITAAGAPERRDRALRAVEEYLIRDEEKLILLFTPPFENAEVNPGYVKAYPPGVRENGGQYTHAAVWVALAFARRGDGERAVELLQMLNPVEHARTPEDTDRYRVEPYVVAADVYSLEGHVGQGGWSWYTGSSGWMYRTWLEEILGFKLRGDRLAIDPVLPPSWPEVKLYYRHRKTRYDIVIENPDHVTRGVLWVSLDGDRLPSEVVDLKDDEGHHTIVVRLGPVAPPVEDRASAAEAGPFSSPWAARG